MSVINIKEGYTRVTEILSYFCNLNNIPQEVLDRASERGTLVHQICEAINLGLGLENIPEQHKGYIDSFNIWLEGKKILKNPGRFYCDDLFITGECDGIYESCNGLAVFDLKTSVSKSKNWILQGAAYAYLGRKSGLDIKQIEFVKLSKDGKKPCIYLFEDKTELFLKCVDVYRYFNTKQ